MTEWSMYGSYDEKRDHWLALGDRRHVYFHGCTTPAPVMVTEDPQGTHLGWIDSDGTTPVMILRKEIFEIQFPYGSRAEVERGAGRVVQLSIRLKEDDGGRG
jgi:hypothetical protein